MRAQTPDTWTPQRHFSEVTSPLLPWISKMELEGITIDTDKLDELRPKFQEKLDGIQHDVQQYTNNEINLRSPNQKSDFIFGTLRGIDGLPIPPTKLTPNKTHYTTAKEDLQTLAYLHPAIPLIIQHGSLSTIVSTFINGLPKKLHPETYRLHPSVNQASTDTSRFSYSPNIQNIPVRDELGREIRQAFIPDYVDHLFITIDQSQIELRWAAEYSRDENMIAIFREGRNLHAETTKFVYAIDEDDPRWTLCYKRSKNGNFARLYGAGKYKLSETLECSVQEAADFLKLHNKLFPGFARWVKLQEEFSRRAGYTSTYFGYRRYIPEIQSSNKILRSRGQRIAVNTPIQGSAAGHIQLAMSRIYNEMLRRTPEARMLFQVHDELNFSAHEEDVETVVEIALKHLESCVEIVVPTPAEVEIGQNWGETVSFEEWKAPRRQKDVETPV
jgi:DNA polymerase-1